METLIFIKYHLELLINCVDIDIYLRTKIEYSTIKPHGFRRKHER